MKNRIVQLLVIVMLFLIPNSLKSQYSIDNEERISQLKSGTTYVMMKDPESEISKDYIAVLEKYWTISKIEFIKYSELENYISPNSFFLSINGLLQTSQWITVNKSTSQTVGTGSEWQNTYLYLELWSCNSAFFKKKAKDPSLKYAIEYKEQIARIDLFPDFPTAKDPEVLYSCEYDGDGHLRNWGPGFLKNYIQVLMLGLEKGEPRKLNLDIENEQELKTLKNNTLYFPDYVLIKFHKTTGDESEKHDEEKLFKKFESNYEIISIADLNSKILNDTDPFYYLIYVKSSTMKLISIVNSSTGEIIYSESKAISYNIDSGDLKKISSLIND